MIFAGTGHRPDKLGGYEPPARMKLERFALQQVRELKPTLIISGMALGWDQALAQAAVVADVPFIAAIPFRGQEEAWPDISKIWYHNLLAEAAETVVVCAGGYASWKMQRRNEWMVKKADTLAALWNGSAGGTANCVRFAEKTGKPIINVWDAWARYTDAGTDRK